MKAFLYSTIFAVLVATPVLSADTVSLVGTWPARGSELPRLKDGAVALRRWS